MFYKIIRSEEVQLVSSTRSGLFKLIGQFLKIGCIGFGGGTALIPVLAKELVTEDSDISSEDIEKQMFIASITPG